MKRKRHLVEVLILFVGLFVIMFSFSVSAYGETETGHISIVSLNNADGRPIKNVKVTVYLADNMEPVKKNPEFNQQDREKTVKLARELEEYIKETNPEPYIKETTGTGSVEIGGIQKGLYLIVFETNREDVTIVPSLVSIPYYGDGTNKDYSVKIEPKIDYLENRKPEENKPKKPTKVKTNDPYRIGFYTGLMTVSFGVILLMRNDEKEVQHET